MRYRKVTYYILVILLITANWANAQSVGNYTVTRNTGVSYNSIISTGTSFAGWRNTTSFIEDDNRSVATNIGFDFWYNGQRYTQFSVSTNGFLDFSSSTADGNSTAAYGSENAAFTESKIADATWLALAPFYDNMTTPAVPDPLGTSIKYQLSGSAPSRILTVEWQGMQLYQNTTPNLNFQVKLHETTGVIEYHYGIMDSGTNTTFSYTVGINSSSIAKKPKVDQLLTQQAANTATFNESIENSLSTIPNTESQLLFTPPQPADPGSTLTISNITSTAMSLSWTDWANNEIGYVIYYSTDAANYLFYSQTAANASSLDLTGLLPGTTYYFKVYAVSEGSLSAAIANSATTLPPQDITSNQSGRWSQASTWDCNCIPSAANNVIILDTHIVEVRSDRSCNNLTIGNGTSGVVRFSGNSNRVLDVNGTLSISSDATVDVDVTSNGTHTTSIGGDFINNGIFNNSLSIILDGTVTQSLSGLSPTTVSNVTINKTVGSVNFNGIFNLLNTLDVQSPTSVDLDGTGTGVFTLVSSATTDARIGALFAGATLTGDMVFEKYFGGAGVKYWRHIGSAVIDASVADIQNEIPISGTFTGNDNGTLGIPVNANPSLYYYNPSSGLVSETLDDRWVVYPTASNAELLTTSSTRARGYAIWVRETGPQTFTLTGPVNSGPINFNISSANEGWNLVGNPYPSDIDWDASGWTQTNIQGGAIHVWDGIQYLSWNGTTGSLGNGRIAKGQGFWVQANASAALSATETVKTGVSAATYRLSTSEVPVLELILSSSGYNDKAYIQFEKNSLAAFDEKDATKLKNSIFNFASLSSDSVALSINVMDGKCNFDVPLVVNDTWNGSYAINCASSSSVFNSYQIELIDRFNENVVEISPSTPQYNFEIDDNEATKSADRFLLRFSTKELNEELNVRSEQRCETEQADLFIDNTQISVLYNIYYNDVLLQSILGSGSDMVITLDSGLTIGNNMLRIQAQRPYCSTVTKDHMYELTLISKPEIIYNAETNILRSSTGIAGLWYSNNEIISSIPSSFIQLDHSDQGIYMFSVVNGNCTLLSDEFLITAVNEEEKKMVLQIWPNPVLDFINIHYPVPFEENIELRIQDVSGKLYYSSAVNPESINIIEYESGVYILTITTKSEQVSQRFIKL